MRVAVGGMAVECCTFSPLPTRLRDLTLLRGEKLAQEYPFLAAYPDVAFSPLLRAKATPGGPVDREVYTQIKAEFLEGLVREGPWEGVYLDMHGAMFVQGMEDAEGDWIAAVREVVGPNCLIAASYDLHGNVSTRVINGLDILTAYRTAPHVDVEITRARAVALLIHCLREQIKPLIAFVPVPVLLPGERAMTTAEPAHSLYASLPQLIADYGLLDASLLVGYAWADEPRVTASAIVVGTQAEPAATVAQSLAEAWWAQRANFAFGMPTGTIDECIQMALAAMAEGTPVFISDAGDNITGGGVGDVPLVLERLLAADVQNAVYAAIVDAEAVTTCFNAGTGADVVLSVGGKLDTTNGTPLRITGTVRYLNQLHTEYRQAVIEIEGIRVILTEQRTAFTTVEQFTELGIDLDTCALVVVKLGYLFPELQPVARYAVLALSPGAINPDLSQIRYMRLSRPAYPLDGQMTWEPQVYFGASTNTNSL